MYEIVPRHTLVRLLWLENSNVETLRQKFRGAHQTQTRSGSTING